MTSRKVVVYIVFLLSLSFVIECVALDSDPSSFSSATLPTELTTINSRFCSSNRSERPIIALHGLNVGHDAVSMINFLNLIDECTSMSHPLYSAPYKIHHSLTIWDLVDSFNDFIEMLITHNRITADREFDIIGLSLGGLVGQLWIQKYSTQITSARKLVTFGSPHYGADVEVLKSRVEAELNDIENLPSFLSSISMDDEILQQTQSCWLPIIKWGVSLAVESRPLVKSLIPSSSVFTDNDMKALKKLESVVTLEYLKDTMVTPSSTQSLLSGNERTTNWCVDSDHLLGHRDEVFRAIINYSFKNIQPDPKVIQKRLRSE